MKKTVIVLAVLAGLLLAACGESGPTDEEKKAAVDERARAKELTGKADLATALAVSCRQDLGGLVKALRNMGSRLNVGLTFADYSNQVGQISIAYDRIPFNRMEAECISTAGVKSEKAFNDYSDAYNQWNECIGDLYCDMDSIDAGLQDEWRKADRRTSQARAALASLDTLAYEAEERAAKQRKKASQAEAVLEEE